VTLTVKAANPAGQRPAQPLLHAGR